MRLQRYGLIFLAIYIVFIAGGYANNVPVIRWFHHAFMTVLAVIWLGWRIRHNRGLPPHPLNTPLLAMLILGFATIPFSSDPRMALENMWLPVMFAMTFWFMVNAFHRAQERILMEIVFLVSAVVIFLSFIQVADAFFGWIGISRVPGQGWIEFLGLGLAFPFQTDLRIFLPLGVSTQVAGFVALLIIISLTWAISTEKKAFRIVLWGMILLLGIILILTFSRGGLISVTAGLLCFFVLRMIQTDRIQNILTGRNLMIIGSLLALVSVVGISVLFLGSQGGRRDGDSLRLDLWRSAVEMITDNPVTGVGTGLYGRVLRETRNVAIADDRISTAHNIYLNVTAEHGLAVILILGATILIVGRSWWQLRSEALSDRTGLLRLNGMMAALIAFAVHNFFDTLTVSASMSLFALMLVYCTVPPAKSRLEERPKGNQYLAIAILLIISAYGIWFVAIVDRAHSHFINSTDSEFDQLSETRLALEIDSNLYLYVLQLAYLTGEDAFDNPTGENLQNAISLYHEALELEPTWHTGMINLAALYEASDEPEQALMWLADAQTIKSDNLAFLHWARFAEANNLADNDTILEYYERGLRLSYLPLSYFWTETALREEALMAYMEQLALDRQYRIAQVHFPEILSDLDPDAPETAGEWWVVGEHALTIEMNTERAIEAFSHSIELAPNYGDYYASRARAYGHDNIEAAERDLQIANFLGTRDEYLNTIQSRLATTPEEIESYSRIAIPGLLQSHDFEAVLYAGRTASFLLYPPVRQIGRGDIVMQIWYDLAIDYEEDNEIQQAIEVYEAIAFVAPEDERASVALERLQNGN